MVRNQRFIKTSAVFALIGFLLGIFALGFALGDDLVIAPNFQLPLLNDGWVSLSDYKDKQPILLMFWTTRCPLCRSDLVLLKSEYPRMLKDNLAFLAINIAESEYRVKGFAQHYDLNFPIALDKFGSAAEDYEVGGLPTYALVDKKGNLVFYGNSFPVNEYQSLLNE